MKEAEFDRDIRHFIYTNFAETTRPATTEATATHFGVPIALVEGAFERLAGAHQIAIAPGTYSVWMAHPFSGVATNYSTHIGAKRYYGN